MSGLTTDGFQYGPDMDLLSLFHLGHAVVILLFYLFNFLVQIRIYYPMRIWVLGAYISMVSCRRPLGVRIITVLQELQETLMLPSLFL